MKYFFLTVNMYKGKHCVPSVLKNSTLTEYDTSDTRCIGFPHIKEFMQNEFDVL